MPDGIKVEPPKKSPLRIEIWPPTKVKYAYLKANYFNEAGILGNSCMRYKNLQKAVNFYTKNNVKIVVVVDENTKIHARALLWENIRQNDRRETYNYLDRIYTNSSHHEKQYKALAIKHKWKTYGSSSPGMAANNWVVDNINMEGVCYLPYTDTFHHLYYKDGFLTSGHIPKDLKHKKDYIRLNHLAENGYYKQLDPNAVKEKFTDVWMSKKDCTKIKRYDGYVAKKNIVDIKGTYYSKFDGVIFETELDGCILKKDKVEEVISNKSMNKNNGIISKEYKGYIHKTNVIKIKNKFYHKDDKEVIQYHKKWFHISQCFVTKKSKALIPKQHALIVYRLKENITTGEIEYVEDYVPEDFGAYTKLTTGEYLLIESNTRPLIKKYNNKYYVRNPINHILYVDVKTKKLKQKETTTWKDFNKPNKNQLMFSFMGAK